MKFDLLNELALKFELEMVLQGIKVYLDKFITTRTATTTTLGLAEQ
jgi:hypothetical protein